MFDDRMEYDSLCSVLCTKSYRNDHGYAFYMHSTKMNETSVNLAETRPNKQIQEVTIAIKCIGTWNVQLGEI